MAYDHDWYAEMDEFAAGEEPPDDELEDLAPPASADEANRLLRRVRSLERAEAELREVTGAEIDRLLDFRDDRLAGIARRKLHYERALEGWTRSRFQESRGKVRTNKLPNGILRVKATPDRLEVFEEAKAVDNFEAERPEWVRTRREVDKAKAKKELLPGEVMLPPVKDGEPVIVTPPGYELREAVEVRWIDCGWFFLPVPRTVPYLCIVHPIAPSFSYQTNGGPNP